MPRLHPRLLMVWCVLVLLSGAGFHYLSHHPRLMLVAEDYHPSFAYERGRQFLRQSDYREAIASFRRGLAYFKQLYDLTGQESHRRQYAQGLLELGGAYSRMGDPASLGQAVELYRQATQLAPDASEGQPYLALGEALERLERHGEAVDPYSAAVEKGSALISLLARYGRGYCRLALGQPAAACEDWYYFARYYDQITPVHCNGLIQLPAEACPHGAFILGRAWMGLDHPGEARRWFQEAWRNQPEKRFLRAYQSLAAGTPVISDAGTIALEEFYPPRGGETPRGLGTAVIDLFRPDDGPCVARLELSGTVEGPSPPGVKIQIDRREAADIPLLGSRPRPYAVRLPLRKGANRLLLRAYPLISAAGRPSILLHSFALEAASGENE
ncbi:MAG: tetratricopeptide repeat protein [bacterium]